MGIQAKKSPGGLQWLFWNNAIFYLFIYFFFGGGGVHLSVILEIIFIFVDLGFS